MREMNNMEAMGRLVGGVAHDFNNVLTTVTLYSDLLLTGLAADSPLRRHRQEIHRATERGIALIQQLLAFSKQQMPESQILSMNGVISGMQDMFSRVLGNDIKLLILCAPDLGNTSINRSQIQQVILNLVMNAREAMPEGGEITIRTENVFPSLAQPENTSGLRPGLRVMLEVRDTGAGMDGQTQAQVFKPFFTTKKSGSGHGLGLPTVHAIVSQSGGMIEIESQVGRGTCMRVFLPRIPTEGQRPIRPLEFRSEGSRSESVLLEHMRLDAPARNSPPYGGRATISMKRGNHV